MTASNFNYYFILGNNKRIEINVDMRCSRDEFTHIIGLDHLKDINALSTNNVKKKKYFVQDILNRKITIDTLEKSAYYSKPFDKTFNSLTAKPYVLHDRISALKNISFILDNAYHGSFYKWDSNKSSRRYNGKSMGRSQIKADYMLCIPNLSSENKLQKIYLFMYQDNKEEKKDQPIKLKIISAFPDCVDLTDKQQRYTILYEGKYEKGDKITLKDIFTHKAYVHNMRERRAAFERMEQLRRPMPDLDEKSELASYRDEKYK